ncbi:hypothetical protein [Hyperthermus butylicus]|uniref:Uncharacterized protein n=1 Tax=Hyperthermus butylicus (strain DSM 5456 / JCM 9403 / PLM1-5) TaxID=415426 RepID=A2BJM4_HYPBU|nr:hypothetical protein [Hyperthermus butylicus]ABM80185.1 hypothetical protein Hbut_0313 [Hyperthermus butylicus DSM 5456]
MTETLSCPELAEGIYTYQPGAGWVRGLREGGKATILVFVNVFCQHACNDIVQRIFSKLAGLVNSGAVGLVLVVCTRFRRVCSDSDARRLFMIYNIIASPSVIAYASNGILLGSAKGSLRVERELDSLLDRVAAHAATGVL